MQVIVDLRSPALKPSKALAPVVRHLAMALTHVNCLILRAGGIPPLYLSGVRYRQEPSAWRPFERFDNAATCLGRGWGDCDDLAAWRCAELLNQGVKAGIVVSWKPTPNGKLYHVTVRLPDGTKDDPSARLGMRPAA